LAELSIWQPSTHSAGKTRLTAVCEGHQEPLAPLKFPLKPLQKLPLKLLSYRRDLLSLMYRLQPQTIPQNRLRLHIIEQHGV